MKSKLLGGTTFENTYVTEGTLNKILLCCFMYQRDKNNWQSLIVVFQEGATLQHNLSAHIIRVLVQRRPIETNHLELVIPPAFETWVV